MSKNPFANWTHEMVAAQNAKAARGRKPVSLPIQPTAYEIVRRQAIADGKPLPPIPARCYPPGAKKLPTNRRNDGRVFENALEAIFTRYASEGVLRLKKCEPPLRVMGGGGFRKVVFLKNPFLDFIGLWSERAGRFVALEAKSTSKPRLPINSKGGITPDQVDALRYWTKAGGVAVVLWEYRGAVRLVLPGFVVKLADAGGKSLKWEDAGPLLSPGNGLERWQVLHALRAYVAP